MNWWLLTRWYSRRTSLLNSCVLYGVSIVNAPGCMNIFSLPMKYSRSIFPKGTQLNCTYYRSYAGSHYSLKLAIKQRTTSKYSSYPQYMPAHAMRTYVPKKKHLFHYSHDRCTKIFLNEPIEVVFRVFLITNVKNLALCTGLAFNISRYILLVNRFFSLTVFLSFPTPAQQGREHPFTKHM